MAVVGRRGQPVRVGLAGAVWSTEDRAAPRDFPYIPDRLRQIVTALVRPAYMYVSRYICRAILR